MVAAAGVQAQVVCSRCLLISIILKGLPKNIGYAFCLPKKILLF